MPKKIILTSIIFSIISAALLFAAGFYYKDLGCDGGWYSYPGLAYSRNGSVDENLGTIESVESVEGVKSLFGFRAYRSIRVFYTTLWFKYVSKDIYFLKLLSLLELAALFFVGYFLISKFCDDKLVVLMLLAVFINDKTIILNGATDFRPDNMVAAFTCLTFLVLLKKNWASVLISAIFACLLVIVHVTAVIPFICIMLFFGLRNIFSGNLAIKENYKYVVVGILALIVFWNRGTVFDILYSPSGHPLPISVVAEDKILEAWNKGPMFMLTKEFYRWKTYFFTTNVAQLLVLFTGIILFFRLPLSHIKRDNTGLALLLSTLCGFVLFAVLDPHRADMHAIPLVPFFFLILSYGINSAKLHRTRFIYVLIGLIWFASLSSMALAGKITLAGERSGYNIRKVTEFFEEFIDSDDRKYLIVGPTEIWPFIQEDKRVLIVDETRSGKNFKILEPIIDSVDYIVINKDYSSYKCEKKFLEYFPDLHLIKIDQIGGQSDFIKVYRLDKKLS